MSVRVTETGTEAACLYCDTSGRAFGPVFESEYEAGNFLAWLGLDARTFTPAQLDGLLVDFRAGVPSGS